MAKIRIRNKQSLDTPKKMRTSRVRIFKYRCLLGLSLVINCGLLYLTTL